MMVKCVYRSFYFLCIRIRKWMITSSRVLARPIKSNPRKCVTFLKIIFSTTEPDLYRKRKYRATDISTNVAQSSGVWILLLCILHLIYGI